MSPRVPRITIVYLDLTSVVDTTGMGATISARSSEMSSALFGEVLLTMSSIHDSLSLESWRVAFQERSIALLNFTEVDQTVQVHGRSKPTTPRPHISCETLQITKVSA